MTPRTLVDGLDADTVAVRDRGFAYGDGVFETLLVAGGEPVWWDAHLARLRRGCGVLGFAAADASLLRDDARRLLADIDEAVLKVTVTRGIGERGYAPPGRPHATRVVELSARAAPDARAARDGVAVRWCATTLAIQPRLAGVKHLNRLEQVLARGEWSDPAIAEGLMCDSEGRVVGATAANLFLVRDGRLQTPSTARCGVDGTCRAWLLEHADVEVVEVDRAQVVVADELFLCSSLRGILPVARLDGQRRDVGPMTRHWQRMLWHDVPALGGGIA